MTAPTAEPLMTSHCRWRCFARVPQPLDSAAMAETCDCVADFARAVWAAHPDARVPGVRAIDLVLAVGTDLLDLEPHEQLARVRRARAELLAVET